jgi:anti-sigma-K factor RskA
MRDDLHVLTGSYALNALTGAERDEFERHLRRCPSCAAEVRGLRETAARLAMAKAVQPPEGMQSRVLDATYRTRQLPPVHGSRAPRDHRWARMPRLGMPRLGMPRLGMPRLGMPRLVAAVAAASVVVAVGLGITQADAQRQLQSTRASDAAITRVVQAPDARLETMRTSAGGIVTVVFSGHQRAAVITTTGMASLPSGRVYQLWVIGPAGARSEGLLTRPGQANQVLASGVVPGERIGITVEPSGGTARPTTTPVVAVPLTT